jgi:hypothetical protein
MKKYIGVFLIAGITALPQTFHSQTPPPASDLVEAGAPAETPPETPAAVPSTQPTLPAPSTQPIGEPNVLQEKAISEFCLKFIKALNEGNFKAAFRDLRDYSIMKRLSQSNVRSKIIDMIKKASAREESLGVEILLEKKAGNFAKKVICAAKYPSYFLMFEFIFYSPASEDKWKLYDLTTTDNIESLFDLGGGSGTY